MREGHKNILDPEFKYVPSFSTDIRRTFERLTRRKQQPAANEAHPENTGRAKKRED
jgi:hypothetical protein